MAFAKFMATGLGRGLRGVTGLVFIWWGMSMSSMVGIIVAIVGVFAVIAGVLNVCFIAPLIGVPFRGKDLSASAQKPEGQP